MKVLFGVIALAAVALCSWFWICRDRPILDDHPIPSVKLPAPENLFPGKGEEQTAFFLSGSYAGYEEASYCTTWDTLMVRKDHTQANVWHLERHTSFQRSIGDHFLPVEQSVSRWMATWDTDSNILKAIGPGTDVSVDPKKSTLSDGKYHFSKIE